MISSELKKLMYDEIIKRGIKMSYSQLIKYLIDEMKNYKDLYLDTVYNFLSNKYKS